MSDYPTLTEMGIMNPEQIDRYSLQTVDNMDLLRIVYKRKKGSILPDSKRFRFPRTEKISPGDNNRETEIYYEVPPVVRNAMVELDKIVSAKKDQSQKLEILKEEVQRLQEETNSRIAYINSLIDDI